MWSARFTDSQLDTLKQLIRIQGDVGRTSRARSGLDCALGRVARGRAPWDPSEQAELQGITEADVIWDMAGRKKEPPARCQGPAQAPKRAVQGGTRKHTS